MHPGAHPDMVPWLLKKGIHIWGVDCVSTDHPMNLPIGRFLGKGMHDHWARVRAKAEEKFGGKKAVDEDVSRLRLPAHPQRALSEGLHAHRERGRGDRRAGAAEQALHRRDAFPGSSGAARRRSAGRSPGSANGRGIPSAADSGACCAVWLRALVPVEPQISQMSQIGDGTDARGTTIPDLRSSSARRWRCIGDGVLVFWSRCTRARWQSNSESRGIPSRREIDIPIYYKGSPAGRPIIELISCVSVKSW